MIDEVVTAIGAHKQAYEEAVNNRVYVLHPQHDPQML